MEIRADHSSIAKELEASQRDEKELETFIETKQKELEEWKAEEASKTKELEARTSGNDAAGYCYPSGPDGRPYTDGCP